MEPWRTLSRQTVLAHSEYLTVECHSVQLPDGRVIADWAWIITPDYINVVAVTADDLFLCFRQTKYAVAGTSLAVVGGYIEPGEDPLQAARRELVEETGYVASEWTCLGSYVVDGNRGAGNAHLYLAESALPVSDPLEGDLEEQELLLLSRRELQAALRQGEFRVLPWAAAVALALAAH